MGSLPEDVSEGPFGGEFLDSHTFIALGIDVGGESGSMDGRWSLFWFVGVVDEVLVGEGLLE